MKQSQIHFTKFRRVLAIAFVVFSVSGITYLQQAQAASGINPTINFQGKVVNKTAGTNVTDGNYDFTFRLYDAASSGTLLWTENWTGGNQVAVTDGIFRVALGSLTSLSSVDFNSDSLYLDITFNGEAMGTRVRFASVPYAFNAQKVNGLTVTNNGGNTLNIAASKTFTVSNTLTLSGTDSTSFAFPSTGGGTVIVSNISGQSIAGAFSLTGTSGNLTLAGTTGLTFSGTGGDITFTNGEKIDNDNDGIIAVTGNLSTSGDFTVSGGDITGANGAVLDLGEATSGDITVVGDFIPATDNTYTLGSSTSSWNTLYIKGPFNLNGSNGFAGNCLQSGGSGAATWGSCGSGGTNWWTTSSDGKALTPINSTMDFLLGGQATTSAKFAILNNTAALSPIASLSATTASGGNGNGIVLSSTGLIQSLRNNTLTIGGDTTGNIILSPRNGSGYIGVGTTTPTDKLTVSGGGVTFLDDNQGLTFFGGITLIKASGGNLVTNGSFQGTSLIGTTSLISPLLTTSSNANLTLTPNGSGQMLLTSDFNSGVQIGSALAATPIAPLYVNNGIGNNAALIVNNLNSGNLIVASAAGTTKFTIDTNGAISAATSSNTINSLVINAGSLSGIAGFAQTTGAFAFSGAGNFSLDSSAFDVTTGGALSGITGLTMSSGAITLGGVTGSGQCITGGATASWGSCGSGGSGTNWWNLNASNGLLTPINGTLDLLLGFGSSAPATSSAKFAVTGMAGSGPAIASVAGNMIIMPQNGAAGRLGIGVSNPVELLEIERNFNGGAEAWISNTNGGADAYADFNAWNGTGLASFGVGGTGYSSNNILLQNRAYVYTDSGTDGLVLYTAGSSDPIIFATDDIERMRLTQIGLLGIGTTSPASALSVTRPASMPFTGKALAIFDQIEDQDLFTASKSGTSYFTVNSTGRINQRGTADALSAIRYSADATGNNIYLAKSRNSTVGTNTILNSGDTIGNLNFLGSDGTANFITAASVLAQVDGTPGTNDMPGRLIFSTTADGASSATERMRIDNAGNVNVGGDSTINALFTVGNASQFQVDGSGNITVSSCTGCGGASGTNYFNQQNGLTWIGNTTTDFAIGGSSTSSAKFVFGGMNAGTPIATFSGDLIMNNRPTTAVTDMQKWNQITGTAGTIGGNSTTGIASISASVVYNGSLYVGTSKSNGAEVYRLDGGSTWTKVTQSTAGTVASGGTANIDMISSMTVWNGSMYIGTTEPNAAEVYRYDGSTNWTKVSQATAGTIRSGGTASIDGISSMTIFQSKLYIGTAEGAKAEVYRYESGTSWIIISTTAGTYVTSNVVNVDAITSMVSYQGSLYLMTKKANDADFLRWTGVPGANGQWPQLNGGTTTASYSIYNTENGSAGTVTNSDEGQLIVYAGRIVLALSNFGSTGDVIMWSPNELTTTTNTFIRLNVATGQMANPGTSNIDGFGSMAIYNGRLYVGTAESNSAQIYRFNGAMGDWTLISQNTAGQIQGGGTTGIDSISTLIQYNHNSLFAGILEGTSTQGYQYSSSIDQSYAIKFNAYSGIAGGEQNLNENLGQIFFVASLSANLNNRQGNTGAFVFSHNLVTNNGSYDVAEDYPTRDETLEPGDLVSVDTNERGFVKKSEGAYDYSTIGIYSESPALRLSQNVGEINGGRAIPIALAGRVPVKVSTENGKIKSGDALTSSSTPGVAMKAKKAGVVIGVAMADYDEEGVGKITAYIKSTSYNGNVADTFASLDITSESFASDALSQLMSEGVDGKSSVVTDRVIAGLEVITPKITADTIIARKIKVDELELPADFFQKALKSGAVESDKESKEITDLKKQVAVLNAQTEDATKAAELTKNKLLESINEKLSASSASATVTQNSSSLSSLNTAGLMLFEDSIRVKKNGLFEGILTVVDTITTNNFIANGISTFFGKTTFKDDTEFEKAVVFNNDAGGSAVIKTDANNVEIKFDKEFEQTPVINASVSFEEKRDEQGNVLDQQALIDKYFDQKYSFVIVGKSSKGFNIVLNKKAKDDIYFNWTALRVKDAKSIQSRGPN